MGGKGNRRTKWTYTNLSDIASTISTNGIDKMGCCILKNLMPVTEIK